MNNIQKYRGLKGITQKELADTLGMTRPGLSYLEHSNAKNVNQKKLEEMSAILGVSIVKLLGEDNLKNIPTTIEDADYMIELLENIKRGL